MSIAQYNNIFSKSFPKDILLEFSDETLIENDQICEEDMSLEESLCSDANLKFGACESSCFKVRVVNNNNFKGLKLNVSMVLKGVDAGRLIDSDGNYLVDSDDNYLTYYDASNPDSATIDIGEYYVIDDEPSNDRMWRDLTCYDAMYFILNADVTAWYAGLTFPMSMKNFRDSFFTWINSNVISISQNTVTLINDNFMIQGGFEASQLSGKDVIESICELNACFGHIDRTGKFDYITLPSSETITYNWYIDGTGSYEDYVTDAITKVTARGEAEDVGTSVGVDGNTLIIENNPLIYGTEGTTALEDALDNILDAVDGFTYRPYEVQTYGNPMLPVGTSIVINTKRYDHEQGYQPFVINSFVMSRTLTGIQALKDSINASGDKERPSEVNSIPSDIKRLKGKTHIMRNTLDELYSEINDPDSGVVSIISQLSDEIVLKVDSTGKIRQAELDTTAASGSEFKVGKDNISFITNGTIEMTSNSLEINSTNFQVDDTGKITATSGEIGGWEITSSGLSCVDSQYSSHSIELNSTDLSIKLCSGIRELDLADGQITFKANSHDIGYIRSEIFTSQGEGISMRLSQNINFIDFNNTLVINDGTYSSSYPEKILLYGSMRCFWPAYFTNEIYLSGSTDDDYLVQNHKAINGTTYQGIKLTRNVFTDGKIFADSHIYTKGINACVNDDVIVDSTSNNHVTGNNSYKGLRLYDKYYFNYAEHFSAADTDGTIRSYMLANNKKSDGTEVYNQLGCGVKKDGTRYYFMTSPTAFRQAINVDGIGETTDNDAPSAKTVNTNTWTSVASITSLPAGKYLLIGTVSFNADSNGNRQVVISTGVNGTAISRHAYVASRNANDKTSLQIVCPISISSATTYYLNAFQDSGSNFNATGQLTAIKIRG